MVKMNNKNSIHWQFVSRYWPLGMVAALISYLALKHLPAQVLPSSSATLALTIAFGAAAPFVAAAIMLAVARRHFYRWYQARRMDRQSGIESLRQLSWQEFEQLIGEYYRRLGYVVQETSLAGADGGVDLRLSQHGKVILVQCKHWQKWKVGVSVVREMLGLVASEGAAGGVVVTSEALPRLHGSSQRRIE